MCLSQKRQDGDRHSSTSSPKPQSRIFRADENVAASEYRPDLLIHVPWWKMFGISTSEVLIVESNGSGRTCYVLLIAVRFKSLDNPLLQCEEVGVDEDFLVHFTTSSLVLCEFDEF